MNYKKFIKNAIIDIKENVLDKKAINALSGGVDSSVVTALAQKSIEDKLTTVFIDTGFMRKNEPETVVELFSNMGFNVELIRAQDKFYKAVKGLTDGEEKRKAFSNMFYTVFGQIIDNKGATYLFQGTNKADRKETDGGVKFQHNVRYDYDKFGIEGVIEPLKELYKHEIRKVARKLGFLKEIYNRQPFPGPGLLVRCLGEATPERINIVREAQLIVEEELAGLKTFQDLVCLAGDTVTGLVEGEKGPGKYMIFVRSVRSKDALTAKATKIPQRIQNRINERITKIPNVCRVLYEITDKPPSTIEYI